MSISRRSLFGRAAAVAVAGPAVIQEQIKAIATAKTLGSMPGNMCVPAPLGRTECQRCARRHLQARGPPSCSWARLSWDYGNLP